MIDERWAAALGIVVLIVLVISGVRPYDRATWLMEVAPVLITAPILVLTYRRFPLTGLLYGLIAVHALVLILGGAYTYARVPLGFISVCIALAVSAFYELVEWWAALAFGQGAHAFLGTQGDPWDTQIRALNSRPLPAL